MQTHDFNFTQDDVSSNVNAVVSAVQHISNAVIEGENIISETLNRSMAAESLVDQLQGTANDVERIVGIIEKLATRINMVGLNASIEAARTGENGKGFTVVAHEVKSLATQATSATNSVHATVESAHQMCDRVKNFQIEMQTLLSEVKCKNNSINKQTSDANKLLFDLQEQVRKASATIFQKEKARLISLARNIVQLIVRNLFERTADVRWWASDEALKEEAKRYLASKHLEKNRPYAANRLRTINQFYTVYNNLILTGHDGTILACSRPEQHERLIGKSARSTPWFRNAIRAASPNEYYAEPVGYDSGDTCNLIATYSAAIFDGVDSNHRPIGVLAGVFDWEEQSKVIVTEEPTLTDEEWLQSRVLLLDRNRRIIADSKYEPSLEPFALSATDENSGFYEDSEGSQIAYSRTTGFQEFDGHGLYGVVIKSPGKSF